MTSEDIIRQILVCAGAVNRNETDMIPQEVMQQIRRIQIRTSHMVNDIAGQYESVFKGGWSSAKCASMCPAMTSA